MKGRFVRGISRRGLDTTSEEVLPGVLQTYRPGRRVRTVTTGARRPTGTRTVVGRNPETKGHTFPFRLATGSRISLPHPHLYITLFPTLTVKIDTSHVTLPYDHPYHEKLLYPDDRKSPVLGDTDGNENIRVAIGLCIYESFINDLLTYLDPEPSTLDTELLES